MASYPALDVRSRATDNLLALIDDLAPTAVEERGDSTRLFFATDDARNVAGSALGAAHYSAVSVDVDDEDWARRSQESLKPVTVGRISIAPPWAASHPATDAASNPADVAIVILPSMGFGTGHHATTRLCLRALQAVDLADRSVLDVGTGSGVLAIAAVRLGAVRALGIDYDGDAIQAATGNLALNPDIANVEFRVADLVEGGLPPVDIVTANLTGAVLVRSASLLVGLLRRGGTLIVSGLLEEERDDVVRALGYAGSTRTRPTSGSGRVGRVPSEPRLIWEEHEDGWVALALKRL